MKSMLKRTTLREIKGSFGRYLAILAIVALGVGFFSGLKVSKPFMTATADQYIKEQKLFDLRLLSTMGFTQEEADAFAGKDGVETAAGSYSYDILCTGISRNETVLKAHSLCEGVNGVALRAGRMPENSRECVLDSNMGGEGLLGTRLVLTEENEESTLEVFKEKEFTVVGIVDASYYMNFERGTTSLGNGRISGFVYLMPEAFDSEYYTEIFLKLDHNYEIYSEKYEDFIKEETEFWKETGKEQLAVRYTNLIGDAEQELADGEAELEQKKGDGERELAGAEEKLADGKAQIEKGRQEISNAWRTLAEKKKELTVQEENLSVQEKQLLEQERELEEKESQLAVQEEALAVQEKELAAREEELNFQENSLKEQEEQIKEKEAVLRNQEEALAGQEAFLLSQGMSPEDVKAQLAPAKEQLASAKEQLNAGKEQIESAGEQLEEGRTQIASGKEQLAGAKAQTGSAREQLEAGKTSVQAAKVQLEEGRNAIEAGKTSIREGETELSGKERELSKAEEESRKGEQEFNEAKQTFDSEVAEAEKKLKKARRDIKALKEPECYVLDRNTNVGYVCFENDSSIVEGIADVFPVFFFLVAALVCITTMNRMVEEQRGQIGVLKALGYTERAIMSKYMFYSGSAALVGCIAGYLGGTWLFPAVIWEAYGIMYSMPGLRYTFNAGLGILSVIVSLVCSIGATWLSCRYELLETAAKLMRPKAPKAGKRVFLEKIPFIWKRLKFLHKVSVRNIFRYKKRFFMMVIGISGCTALLVTGLGLKDSVMDLAPQQYEEIQTADGSVSLKEDADIGENGELMESLASLAKNFTFVCEESWDLLHDGGVKAVNLVIFQKPEEHGEYLNLHTKKDVPVSYPGKGEAVISHKLAETYAVSVGDKITVRREDMREITVKVSGIFENFLFDYVYLAPETFASQMGEEPDYKSIYVNYKEEKDVHEAAAALMKQDDVSAVSVNQDVMKRFDSMMDSLNYVVLLVIFSAGMLAFIVLYNLTNINITERIREIATIKVLGFYRRETSSYVFRENLVLTAIGAGVGLVLGYFLHQFIMSKVVVDMVAFDVHIRPVSYCFSILLTFLFHFIVNAVMAFKLEAINMAESLKSVD